MTSPSPDDEGAAPAPASESPTERPARKEKAGKSKDAGKESGKETKGKAKAPAAPGAAKGGKPIPDNPNFRYIVRFVNTDLDGRRSTALALTGVSGVGLRVAETACRLAGVNPTEMIGNLPEPTVERLEGTLQGLSGKVPGWFVNHPFELTDGASSHYIGADLETRRRDDINLLKMIRAYRGVRHERGQKVRGQRTRSNGRTGMAAGVLKKAAKEAAQAKSKEESAPAASTAAPAAKKGAAK